MIHTMDTRDANYVIRLVASRTHGRKLFDARYSVIDDDGARELMGDPIDDRSEHAPGSDIWREERTVKLGERPSTDLVKLGRPVPAVDGHYFRWAGACYVVTDDGAESWTIPLNARGDRTCQGLAGRSTRKGKTARTGADRVKATRMRKAGADEHTILAEMDRRAHERELAQAGRIDAGTER